SNSCSPSSSSSRLTAWLTAGWVRWTLAAAREKLRSSATVRKIRRAVRSINFGYCNVIIITLTSSWPDRYNKPTMNRDATRIIIFDTTLRDGEQAPGFSMDVASKLNLARHLDA